MRPEGLERGVDLFNRGLYWDAHEAWEEAWTPDRHGSDRDLYKGLIQIAAGCLHYGRHNRRGAVNKWRSGTHLLASQLPSRYALDIRALVADVEALLTAMEAPNWPTLTMPHLKAD